MEDYPPSLFFFFGGGVGLMRGEQGRGECTFAWIRFAGGVKGGSRISLFFLHTSREGEERRVGGEGGAGVVR